MPLTYQRIYQPPVFKCIYGIIRDAYLQFAPTQISYGTGNSQNLLNQSCTCPFRLKGTNHTLSNHSRTEYTFLMNGKCSMNDAKTACKYAIVRTM